MKKPRSACSFSFIYILMFPSLLTAVPSQVNHLSYWKRTDEQKHSVDRDTEQAVHLLLQLSHPVSTIPTEGSPVNQKKRKRTVSEKERLKKNERRKLSLKREKEEYDNRLQLPSDSEERKRIEKKHDEKVQKAREISSKHKKAMFQRLRSGNPTEADVRKYERDKLSASVARRKRYQRIKEGKAKEIDMKSFIKHKNQQALYREKHREQKKEYNAKYRAKRTGNM